MTLTIGASALNAPNKNKIAQNLKLPLRPKTSDSLPPISAPIIAPNSSVFAAHQEAGTPGEMGRRQHQR